MRRFFSVSELLESPVIKSHTIFGLGHKLENKIKNSLMSHQGRGASHITL